MLEQIAQDIKILRITTSRHGRCPALPIIISPPQTRRMSNIVLYNDNNQIPISYASGLLNPRLPLTPNAFDLNP